MRRLSLSIALTLILGAALAAPALAAAPSVTTGGASAVTPTSATVSGTVNPRGRPTSYYFEFGKTTAYGTRTNTGNVGSDSVNHSLSASLSGLTPNTTYHYRLVAFSTDGTARGSDLRFTTPQIPTTAAINLTPNPSVFGRAVLVTGNLSGPSVGGVQVALEANPFPFTGGFQQVGNTALTTPQGGYTFVYPAFVNTQLRVVDKSKSNVASPVATLAVELKATLRVRASRRSRGLVRFSGGVAPAKVGNPVQIQRRVGNRWVNFALTLTRKRNASSAAWSKWVRLKTGGVFRALVRTTGGDFADGPTNTARITLR
jgi:hypothetical protein